MKKLFGGIKMTWPRVILAAILAGVITALAAMLIPDGNSFHEIAVSFEAWILFAILIIVNCEKPLEAALKTFVFFLLSQPLVYLIQVPFSWMGWGLFGYYRFWFILTLLTFPGAYLGWFIKKDNVWSGLILSVMLVLLVSLGLGYAEDVIDHFPKHLVSALFCFGQILLYIFVVLQNKKARIAAAVITVAAFAVMFVLSLLAPPMDLMTGVDIDEAKYPVDETWTVRTEDEAISTAELVDMGEGDYILRLHLYDKKKNTVTLSDGEGNEYPLVVYYEDNDGLRVEEAPENP